VTNIENNDELNDEFSLVIPVVKVDEQIVSESTIDIPELRKFFEKKFNAH
jgi:hypothetical protein